MFGTQRSGKPIKPLVCDEEKGWILEGDVRIVSFRIKTFQTLSDQLEAVTGPKIAGVLLNQIGLAAGRVVMNYSRDKIQSQADLSAVLDSTLKARGWGRCVDIKWQSSGTRTTFTVKLKGSPLSHERHSKQPVCHLLRGAISGWLEAYSGRKEVESIEKECESIGKPFCIFEITLDRPFASAGSNITPESR